MLHRQRVVIEMLKQFDRPVSKLQLVKLLFLLKIEGRMQDINFYDFLPYKFGPFSFDFYQDLRKLEQDGVLTESTSNGQETVFLLKKDLPGIKQIQVGNILSLYGNLTISNLIDYVYSKYPWFTINTQLQKPKPSKPKAPISIYTIGYEKKSIDFFLNQLLEMGITQVIDIRNNPISRVYGYHKSTLGRLTTNVGIRYSHFPEFGISKEDRNSAKQNDNFESLFRNYSCRINNMDVTKILSLMNSQPSALLCQEADPNDCHRSRLAEKLSNQSHLSIKHI